MSKILQVENLVQEFNLTKDFLDKVKFKNGHFSLENRVVHAVNNVSFDVEQGEVFSLVGESGCGKSTTARTIIKLIEPKSGKIIFDGRDITRLKPQEMRPIRREMQMIFQDPYASLNPRQKIMEILTDPMLSVELFGSAGAPYFAVACALSYLLSGYCGLYSSQTILYSKLRAEFINVRTHE